MTERTQFIGSHLPRVASDPSPVWSRFGAERNLSFASHASPTSLLAKGRPSVVFRSRNFAFLVGAGELECDGAMRPPSLRL